MNPTFLFCFHLLTSNTTNWNFHFEKIIHKYKQKFQHGARHLSRYLELELRFTRGAVHTLDHWYISLAFIFTFCYLKAPYIYATIATSFQLSVVLPATCLFLIYVFVINTILRLISVTPHTLSFNKAWITF